MNVELLGKWMIIASAAVLLFMAPACGGRSDGAAEVSGGDGNVSAKENVGDFGAQAAGDPVVPLLGNGGYDIEHYDIAIEWDQTDEHLSGVATITAKATQDLDGFYVDLAELEATKVTVNGVEASFDGSDPKNQLKVTLEDSIQDGAEFTYEVSYSGKPSADVTGIVPSGWHIGDSYSYALGEPRGAAYWFPGSDHPSDKATFSLAVTAPTGDVVVSNGLHVGKTTAGSKTTWKFEMDQPMATYLATVIIGDFVVVDRGTYKNVRLRDAFPKDSSPAVRKAFDQHEEMLDYFSNRFGRYPFDVYGAAVVPEFFGAALETQTLSVFAQNALDSFIVAHELAHQWFGNSVSITKFEDLWLNEGFATYAHVMWRAHERGIDMEEALMVELGSGFQGALDLPPAMPNPNARDIFHPSVYVRGSLTLHALRLEVGDERFFEILRAWASDYKYSNATTHDFIALAEKVSGKSLDELFDVWLFKKGLPDRIGDIDLSRL